MRRFLLLALPLAACAPAEEAPVPAMEASEPTMAATADGFSTPESVIFDAAQDAWFVTNINGHPGARDNNGFISRLRSDGSVDSLRFIAGGRDGVTLHAPKGQAITGDTLWVTDIDAIRGFHRRTAAPVATIQLGGQARFLNDLAVGPDGALYATDSGIAFDAQGQMSHPGPDRIFRIAGRSVTVGFQGPELAAPNGITWDPRNNYFIVVPFAGTDLLAWRPGLGVTPIATGPGSHDGVEILADGRVLVSSWADSTVFVMGGGDDARVIRGVPTPADIGVDTALSRVAIPLFTLNRVEIWSLPSVR